MTTQAWLRRTVFVLGFLCLVGLQTSRTAETCGLRPPSDEAPHPADLEAAEEKGMDADGDGTVTTEEFVKFAEAQAAGPVDLTAENFDEKTAGTSAAFVEFMAPWCGHCQTMAPEWAELATKVHTEYSGVRVGTVNCDEQRDFCEMFQIQGFPTLLLMKDPNVFEDATPVLYQKERNAAAMFEFLKEEKVLANAASAVGQLTPSSSLEERMDEDGRGGVVSSTGNRGSVWRGTDAYASKGGDSEEQMSLAARRGSEGEGQGRMGQRKHEAGKGPFRSERRKSSLNKEHGTNRRQHQRPKPVLT
eukprot:CAMPEP_0177700564 /NCGR_PEP_ID=MMETSP0484_2-20121128/6159_1 /TAXON_ID=354590 /ORGANISM="Rhodomonas lens, Strain RHODO" /LENGTH=302 /DNA_ID=CAMNT_0019211767 /DNA_START=51 /DNA_END=957 /DNA_ORIENTATION=+